MKMCQEYVLDFERMLGGKRNVLVGVTLRIDDGCGAASLVSDNVRGWARHGR